MATILVIDGDLLMRRQIVETLATAGYDTCEAMDGAEGVRMFSLVEPDLVITEVVLAEKDGLEIIGELRRELHRVPIIAICESWVGRGRLYLELAKHFGADAAIAKPFGGDELVDAVHRLL